MRQLGMLVLLAAGLLSCATTLPPPAEGRGRPRCWRCGSPCTGRGWAAGSRSGSGGYWLGSLGLSMFNGEAAAARLQDRATGRVYYPTRFLNGFSLFANIPPGSYRLDAVQIGTETTVYLAAPAVGLRVEGGGARYGGTLPARVQPGGGDPRAGGPEEERGNREALARLLAARGQGRWALQRGPAGAVIRPLRGRSPRSPARFRGHPDRPPMRPVHTPQAAFPPGNRKTCSKVIDNPSAAW